jgi:hypothetical protein
MVSWTEIAISIFGFGIASELLYRGYLKYWKPLLKAPKEATGEVNEAYFSIGRAKEFDPFYEKPRVGETRIINAIVDYIESAQKSIYMAVYMCKVNLTHFVKQRFKSKFLQAHVRRLQTPCSGPTIEEWT